MEILIDSPAILEFQNQHESFIRLILDLLEKFPLFMKENQNLNDVR